MWTIHHISRSLLNVLPVCCLWNMASKLPNQSKNIHGVKWIYFPYKLPFLFNLRLLKNLVSVKQIEKIKFKFNLLSSILLCPRRCSFVDLCCGKFCFGIIHWSHPTELVECWWWIPFHDSKFILSQLNWPRFRSLTL